MPTPDRRRKEAAINLLGLIGWPQIGVEPVTPSLIAETPGGQSYADYIASLAPLLWLRLRETSGTSVANSGSLGGSGTWTAGSGALGQTGKLGANEALLFDGSVSKIVSADNPKTPAFTACGLAFGNSQGENSAGAILHTGQQASDNTLRVSGAGAITSGVDTDSTDAVTTSVNGAFETGKWIWYFATYDDNGDRKIYLYKGLAGALSNIVSSQTAATGIRSNSGGYQVGNFSDVRTWDGLIDEVLLFPRILTSGEMLRIIQLSGV